MSHEMTRYEARMITAVSKPSEHDLVQVDDVLQFVRIGWRRKWLILASLLVAVGLGVAYYKLMPPTYCSKAQVLVVQKRPLEFPGMDPQAAYFQDDMSTHLTVIKSPWFAEGVLKMENVATSATLVDEKNPRVALTKLLTVTQENPLQNPLFAIATTLNLEFVGVEPEEARVILVAVLKRYKEFLDETSQRINDESLKRITVKAEEVHKELREKEQAYKEFRKKTPLLWNPKDDTASYKSRLAEIESARSILNVRREETESKLAAIRRSVASGRPRDEILGLVPEDSKWRSYQLLEERLYPLLAQEKALAKDYGPGHPQLMAIREQIELARDYFSPSSASRNQLLDQINKDHDVRLEDPIDSYRRSLEQQLEEIKASEQALTEQFDQERQRAEEVANYELQNAQHASEITRITQYYDTLIKQLQGVNMSKDLLGYSVNVIAPPDYGVKASPLALRVFPVAVFLGLVCGVGVALLADSSQRSFHTPQEVRHQLGLPVVGCIPRLARNGRALVPVDAQGAAMAATLCTQSRPNSLEAEAYRGVRAALYFSTSGKPQKVIQVTSPAVGDGKTLLAANLAISIAQSGRKILLIDADLRRPQLHQLFGHSARTGLSSVIAGEVALADAVQPSAIADLWLLPSGPLPPNPADLLTSPRFSQLLEAARTEFDFVLVDTPALLAVTDPRVVAPLVDGVLLTFRLTSKSRPDIERAKEVLEDLQANVLGAVVNAADQYVEFTKYEQYAPTSR